MNASIRSFLETNTSYSFESKTKNKFGQKDTLDLPFFDDFSELLKDKLVDKNGITNTFVESDFPKVYKSYLEISKSSIEDIHANIDKYYNFYVKSKTIGFATFKGEDISRAFTFF